MFHDLPPAGVVASQPAYAWVPWVLSGRGKRQSIPPLAEFQYHLAFSTSNQETQSMCAGKRSTNKTVACTITRRVGPNNSQRQMPQDIIGIRMVSETNTFIWRKNKSACVCGSEPVVNRNKLKYQYHRGSPAYIDQVPYIRAYKCEKKG